MCLLNSYQVIYSEITSYKKRCFSTFNSRNITMIMLTSGACDRNAAHFPAAPSGRSPLFPSAFPKKLRSIALQVLVWTFACSTGQLQAEGITPGLRAFDVT